MPVEYKRRGETMNFQELTQNEAMTVCGVRYEILRLLGHGKGVKRILT